MAGEAAVRMTTVADYGGLVLLNKDGTKSKRRPLLQKRYIFGSADHCEIRMNLLNVSREHAEIVVDEKNRVWVRSLSMTAIVTVDGNMVKETILQDGSKIGIEGRNFIYDSHCNTPGSANKVRAAALRVPLGRGIQIPLLPACSRGTVNRAMFMTGREWDC